MQDVLIFIGAFVTVILLAFVGFLTAKFVPFYNPKLAKEKLAEIVAFDQEELDNFEQLRSNQFGLNMRNKTTRTFMSIASGKSSEYIYQWLPSQIKEEPSAESQGKQLIIGDTPAGTIPIFPVKLLEQGVMDIGDKSFEYCKAVQKIPTDNNLTAVFWAQVQKSQENQKTQIIICLADSIDKEVLDREVANSLKLIKHFR